MDRPNFFPKSNAVFSTLLFDNDELEFLYIFKFNIYVSWGKIMAHFLFYAYSKKFVLKMKTIFFMWNKYLGYNTFSKNACKKITKYLHLFKY